MPEPTATPVVTLAVRMFTPYPFWCEQEKRPFYMLAKSPADIPPAIEHCCWCDQPHQLQSVA